MMPPLIRLALCTVLAACAAGLPAGAAQAATADFGNGKVYLDLRAGDGGDAPDIFVTTVSVDENGTLRFDIVLTNRSSLGPDDFVGIFINSDHDATTGGYGSDWVLQAVGSDSALGHWSGSVFEHTDSPSFRSTWVGDTHQQFEVSAAELGISKNFTFYTYTFVVGNEDKANDSSPDGDDVWEYSLESPSIANVFPHYLPWIARAGAPFRITGVVLHLDSGEAVKPTGYTCRATLAGKPLRGTGAGGCSFLLPKTAKGKPLKVWVTASYGDKSKSTLAYSARVR